MFLKALDTREATAVGKALADDIATQTAKAPAPVRRAAAMPEAQRHDVERFLRTFLLRVDQETRTLELNVFKRAKLANSFKWELLEKGLDPDITDELTQALVLRLTGARSATARPARAADPGRRDIEALVHRADRLVAAGEFTAALEAYRQVLRLDARHPVAHNNAGGALCKLGHYAEAAEHFRRAIGLKSGYAEAHCNLGNLLRWRGRVVESEPLLRRALKLKPTSVDAQLGLSATLTLLGHWREAKALLEKVLRIAPRNAAALVGLSQILGSEGHFAEAEALVGRAVEAEPTAQGAWAALVSLRQMTRADHGWLERAEALAAAPLAPLDEANIRYAIGKYCDDVGEYGRAFRSYQRANELQKSVTETYDRDEHTRFVDDMRRIYSHEALAVMRPGASDSARPVLLVGMPRSGTSLVEQIIASHPAAHGAGELGFWSAAMQRHESVLRREPADEALGRKLSAGYLHALDAHAPQALRVIDKAPFNAGYLGLIHQVLPRARFIYVQRDPLDTCLSCYFQQLSAEMSFATDLADLAHYYREHQRLMAHWRGALPQGVMLTVPYAELVADQEGWTRRMLEFLGLDWDPRCLDFERTQRTVLTASFWQVRQKLYQSSVGRWRNYRKFIGPLLELRSPD